MARVIATHSATHVCIVMTRKDAKRLAELLDSAGDWFGNTEAADIGMTSRQLAAAECDLETLIAALNG